MIPIKIVYPIISCESNKLGGVWPVGLPLLNKKKIETILCTSFDTYVITRASRNF